MDLYLGIFRTKLLQNIKSSEVSLLARGSNQRILTYLVH